MGFRRNFRLHLNKTDEKNKSIIRGIILELKKDNVNFITLTRCVEKIYCNNYFLTDYAYLHNRFPKEIQSRIVSEVDGYSVDLILQGDNELDKFFKKIKDDYKLREKDFKNECK